MTNLIIKKPNGRATKKRPTTLAKAFKRGTDTITIGSDLEADDSLESSTLADASKVIDDVRYLVKDWVPFGMITGIVAEPGIGKSAFVLGALAGPIIKGTGWFNHTKGLGKPHNVLWLATENDMGITLKRVKDWGFPLDRLKLPFEDPLETINLGNPAHIERVEHLINRHATPLVVLDSLRGGHSGDENNSQVGSVLKSLAEISERTKAAVSVVHHTRKLMVDEEITANSSRGSNAILAMFRAQLGIDKPDSENPWCRLQMMKENLGLKPKPVGFQVTTKGLEFGECPRKKKKENGQDQLVEWLQSQMEPGKKYRSANLEQRAEQAGYAVRSLRRASEQMNIEKTRIYKDGKIDHWLWSLPKAQT